MVADDYLLSVEGAIDETAFWQQPRLRTHKEIWKYDLQGNGSSDKHLVKFYV